MDLITIILFFSVHQVEVHLRDYLDRSYRLLVENEAEVADQNLCLLIIQCFEVCVCVCVCVCECICHSYASDNKTALKCHSLTSGCTV